MAKFDVSSPPPPLKYIYIYTCWPPRIKIQYPPLVGGGDGGEGGGGRCNFYVPITY